MASPGRAPSRRGIACLFGPDVTKRFLDDNGLDLLVRSHEVLDVSTFQIRYCADRKAANFINIAFENSGESVNVLEKKRKKNTFF
jgi:hypothetical protein